MPSDSCKEVFAILSQYLDLELPPEACGEIEQHIEGCEPCVEFVESLRKTVDLCRKYQPEEMPPPLSESARAELENAWRKMLEIGQRHVIQRGDVAGQQSERLPEDCPDRAICAGSEAGDAGYDPPGREAPFCQFRCDAVDCSRQPLALDGVEDPPRGTARFATGHDCTRGVAGDPAARRPSDVEAKRDRAAHVGPPPSP